jgi:hypothetical protein
MAREMETAMAHGKATEMAAAGGGNDSCQPQQWPAAATMSMGYCNGDSNGNGDGDGNGVGDGDGNVDGNGDGHGNDNQYKGTLPLHVVAMCGAFGWAISCLHPHGHKESAFTSAASWG